MAPGIDEFQATRYYIDLAVFAVAKRSFAECRVEVKFT